MTKKDKKLKKIKKNVIECKKCNLYETATNPVIGEGSHDADIMLIGEAPGKWEDKKARPFVGKAGEILDELLESANLKRGEIYIANILKHRPPQNRDPEEKEIKACGPYLDQQIEIIEPDIIATLGNFAKDYIFKKYGLEDQIKGISQIKGQIFTPANKEIKIIPQFHPAVAVYNANKIDELKEDFQKLKR